MKTAIIYLAAGSGRRFGENKLFYELEGKSLYRHLLERLISAASRHRDWSIFVVSRYPELLEELKEFPVTGIYCKESIEGISRSIGAGVRAAAEAGAENYAFFVADQPFLQEETAERFLEEMEQQRALLGCVACGSETGNPAWFSSNYREELLSLTGDRGGKKILKAHPEEVVYFQVADSRELEDVDVRPGGIGTEANLELL